MARCTGVAGFQRHETHAAEGSKMETPEILKRLSLNYFGHIS